MNFWEYFLQKPENLDHLFVLLDFVLKKYDLTIMNKYFEQKLANIRNSKSINDLEREIKKLALYQRMKSVIMAQRDIKNSI